MPRDKFDQEPSFGFLSTLDSPEHGYFGGYLIVSQLGRPLEFHCTSPVRPSRAQEILYGPTLQPYLLGEQISSALLIAAKTIPRLIVTDTLAMLAARVQSKSPVVLLQGRSEGAQIASSGTPASDPDVLAFEDEVEQSRLSRFQSQIEFGGYELLLPTGFGAERHAVLEALAQLTQHIELAEPFGRIHEAISEAQRIGGRGGEAHGQAA
jgi:hypothetical protein